MNLSQYIDHTLLKPTATEQDILQLCEEAISYQFYAVCVNSCYVHLCKEKLLSTPIKIASVIGFPLGAMLITTKIYEAKEAIRLGADEIDMVINIGFLKDGKYDLVEEEIRKIKDAIGSNTLKVIIETCYLTKEEISIATKLTVKAGADYIKTSTGFGSGGATLEDVAIMKSNGENKIKIKASGGIRDYETAMQYIELGVNRIGTSNGIQIVTGQEGNEQTY